MRALTLMAVLQANFLSTTLVLAHPLGSSSLIARLKSLPRGLHNPAIEWAPDQRVCSNSPHTIAGTFFHPRSLPPITSAPLKLHPRNQDFLWCCPSTQTYIALTIGGVLPASRAPLSAAALALIGSTYRHAIQEIRANGNTPLPHGSFQMMGDAPQRLLMNLWCTGAGSLTWQVAANALVALEEFMHIRSFAGITFQIFDEGRRVGMGQIN